MKKLGLIALCGLFAGISFSQTDLENLELKGKIKSIESNTYRTTKKGKKIIILSTVIESKSEYNEDGYLLSNNSRYTTKSLGTGAWRKAEYKLNDENQPTKALFYKDNELFQTMNYEYNNKLLVSKSFLNQSGKVFSSEKIYYNSNDLEAKKSWFNLEGAVKKQDTTIYNKDKKVVEYKLYRKGVNVLSKYTIFPTKNSKKTTEVNADKDTTLVTLIEYNDKDEMIVFQTLDAKGKTIKKTTYEYNDKDDLILKRSFDETGDENNLDFMRYEYEYDDKGNWIKKTEFMKGGNSLDMTVREIVYFD